MMVIGCNGLRRGDYLHSVTQAWPTPPPPPPD